MPLGRTLPALSSKKRRQRHYNENLSPKTTDYEQIFHSKAKNKIGSVYIILGIFRKKSSTFCHLSKNPGF
jgi:hypothetical protein